MRKLNNKGLAPLLIVGVIVLIGIVGFTGWYVYDTNKTTTQIFDNSKNAQKDVTKTEEISLPDKDGRVTSKFDQTEFSFVPPEGWKLEKIKTKIYDSSSYESFEMYSPDYKVIKATEGAYEEDITGTYFTFSVNNNKTDIEATNLLLSKPDDYLDDMGSGATKIIKHLLIGGEAGVQYVSGPAGHSWELKSTTIYEGGVYQISTPTRGICCDAVGEIRYKTEYDSLVSSVKFN